MPALALASEPFEKTGWKDERSLSKNVQLNGANSPTVKVRNAVADVTIEAAQNCMLEIDCSQRDDADR